jgi:hypothetical protein
MTCLWLKTRAKVQNEGSGIRGENSLPSLEDSRPRKVSFSPCRNIASSTSQYRDIFKVFLYTHAITEGTSCSNVDPNPDLNRIQEGKK